MMRRILPPLLLLLLCAATAFAKSPVNKGFTGVAIRGYDPVAYFQDGKPVKGSSDFTFAWNGATWHFASAAHRDAFAKSPAAFAPQYGGYCAYGVSRGYAVPVDPEAWRVVNGKLYLNYSLDVRKEWLKDVPGHVKKADANWPKVLEK
jgi:YHS domain-containing protein